MFTLVYASSAARAFSTEDLLTLLAQSRAKNERLGVTGILLYKDGDFMQVLEGEEQVVTALYERIAADPRHNSLTRLIQATHSQRQFPAWSMGFHDLSDPALHALPGYSQFLNTPLTDPVFTQTPSLVYTLLQAFKESQA